MRYLPSIIVITVMVLSASFVYGADVDTQNSNEDNARSSIIQMSFCPNCGAELKEGAKFCHECGYDLIANPLSEGVEIEEWKIKEKSISEISPYAGIFGSLYSSSADYIFGVNIYFQKPKYNIDNSIYLHPEDGLYLYFSNKEEIIIAPSIPQYEFGPFFGVDFEGFLYGDGSMIFIGPNLGFYMKFIVDASVKTTLKPSFYISPTWVIGSGWGEPVSAYASTNIVFDFDARFYFSENVGFLTNLKLKTGSANVFSLYYLTLGPSFSF